MNRRVFLFIGLIGLAFVGSQTFFGYKEFGGYKKVAQQQQEITKQILSQVENTGVRLVSWKKDEQQKESIDNQGVALGNSFIVLNKGADLPQTLLAEGKSWDFVAKSQGCHGLSVGLYRDSDSSKPIADMGKVFLPGDDQALSVLVVEYRNGKAPVVFSGEYKDGKILNHGYSVYGTALVFWKSGNEFLPLGLYSSVDEKLVELKLPMTRAIVISQGLGLDKSGVDAHYVLQNEYLQLVISEYSGSIEGINLPLRSDSHPQSIINETEFERILIQEAPEEAQFPGFVAKDYKGYDASNTLGGYYPLLRRGIFGGSGELLADRYHAMNLVYGNDLKQPLSTRYRVVSFVKDRLVLESIDSRVRKEFSLPSRPEEQPYVFNVDVKLAQGRDKVWITSGIPEVEILSNAFVPSVRCRELKKGGTSIESAKLPKSKAPLAIYNRAHLEWAVNSNGYFGVIITPKTRSKEMAISLIPGKDAVTKLSLIDRGNNLYPASRYPGYELSLPLDASESTHSFRVYAGPLAAPTLNVLDDTFERLDGVDFDYKGCLIFRGVFGFISEPFAKLLFVVMKFFKFLTNSWGISIILLTLFLKIVLYPLNAWSIRSMRRMQKLSPYIQDIQKKYKNEPKKAQMEIISLYKENKVNPLMGCFPLLIQLPFLIAMFDLLKSSFLLRGASFIPGWIDNLTAPDVLFSWNTSFPLIGNQLHLLPIVLGLVMFAQQKISNRGKDGELTDQQRQQQAMGTLMAVLFTVMFYNFPSGLNLYWLSSTILGIAQQWIANKVLDGKHLKNEVIVGKKKNYR